MTEDPYSRAVRLARALQRDLEERINRALAELGDPYLVRARLVISRIKSEPSLQRKAGAKGWTNAEAIERIEDFIGLRIVCNNHQDVQRTAQLVTAALEATGAKVRNKDYIQRPKSSGYRAIHLLFENEMKIGHDALTLGCEIQIRTLAQDVWGHLSHEDIYKGNPSKSIREKTRRLSDVLATADRIAEEIRREVVKPKKGRKPPTGAKLTRSSIAFVYKRGFGEHPPDYIVEWILRDFGKTELRADGLDQTLQDTNLLNRLQDAYTNQTRWAPGPEQVFRWAVIASKSGLDEALKEAARDGKRDWKEVDTQYKSEVAASLPEDLEDLQDILRGAEDDGDPDWDVEQWAAYFDAKESCGVCGTRLIDFDTLADGLVERFGLKGEQSMDAYEKIQRLLANSSVEDSEGGELCGHCRYMMSKD